jgi:hypothetical protein
MLPKLLIAWCLLALCVAIHATGLTLGFTWLKRRATPVEGRIWPATWLLIAIAGWALSLHLLEIVVWAFAYAGLGAMADLTTSIYFSAVTYTTTGYGDLVLPPDWRLVGAVEALTGILMCGLSTGLFFAVFSKVFRLHGGSTPTN